ncbi:MAG: hypothetical protein RLY59_1156 [Actinomycetota bacterium]
MTTYLLAGGGTAGHVNPMLAIADALRAREPEAIIICVGTAEGLEAQLVPARGYELITIPRIPFPRARHFLSSSRILRMLQRKRLTPPTSFMKQMPSRVWPTVGVPGPLAL